MNAAKLSVTKPQLGMAYQRALEGYTKAYGQTHDTPAGKFCWMGRIDRGYTLLSHATNEMDRKKMEKGVKMLVELAEKDFVTGEKAHADYVDLCSAARITPQAIEPNCQCQHCQRVPGGAELLFALERGDESNHQAT